MQFRKPGLSSHVAAVALAAAQAVWILRVDRRLAPWYKPLLPEIWQQVLSCVAVAGLLLLAASVRPGPRVLDEVLCDALRSILVGAVLSIGLFQVMGFFDQLIHPSPYAASPWSGVREFSVAWPILSVFVMGSTAGNSTPELRNAK